MKYKQIYCLFATTSPVPGAHIASKTTTYYYFSMTFEPVARAAEQLCLVCPGMAVIAMMMPTMVVMAMMVTLML